MSNKTGLVLAGGGGKGAYHIGVWKALNEYGIDKSVSCVSGTSIGALNAALFVQGDVSIAENIWRSLSNENVLTTNTGTMINNLINETDIKDLGTYIKHRGNISVFSRHGLKDIIDNHVDLDYITNSQISAYGACADGMNKYIDTVDYLPFNNISTERLEKILFASSAIPVGFDPIMIDGKIYIDGGLIDNVPVKPVYDEGCNIIIVIHLNRNQPIDVAEYPNAKIIEIVPSESIGGFFNGTIDFSQRSIKARIDLGYSDAKQILEPVMHMIMTQGRLMKSMHQMKNNEEKFDAKLSSIRDERENLKNELESLLKGE